MFSYPTAHYHIPAYACTGKGTPHARIFLHLPTQKSRATAIKSAFFESLKLVFSLTGETAVAVRMAVVMRRKLQFYYWKNRKFHKLQEDLTVPDVPRSLAWAGEALCLGTR